MASGGVKGFFREKKKAKAGSGKKINTTASASCVQPPALISHATLDRKDEYDENEVVMREFDMNMAYGPCIGMDRLERWERANKLGLKPPPQVENLLRREKVNYSCLWDDRV